MYTTFLLYYSSSKFSKFIQITRICECFNRPSLNLDDLTDPTTLLNFQCCIWKNRYFYCEGNYKLATFERILIHPFTLGPEFCRPFVISTFPASMAHQIWSSWKFMVTIIYIDTHRWWHLQGHNPHHQSRNLHIFAVCTYYSPLFLFATPCFKSRSGNELSWQVYVVFPVSPGHYCDSTTN